MSHDIIGKLEVLTGPCREVDADIYIALNIPAERVARIDRLGGCVGWWPKDAPYESAVDVPCYTASIDAAVALAKAKVPGWRLRIEFGDNYSIAQFVRGWGARKEILGIATSERPDDEICLAICSAAFRALEAEGARDD